MLLLPMFLASVHLSRVNLNGIGDALMAADGPGTHDGLTGAFALQTSGFSPNCGSASRKWQREEGSVFRAGGFGNGTSTTDIETRPNSPRTSSKVPLPNPSPASGRHRVCARTPTHSPAGSLNS